MFNTLTTELRTIFGVTGSSSSGSGGRAVASAEDPSGTTAVWVSIDPRTGELSLYPPAAVFALEQAHRSGRRQVSLHGLGLGPVYERLSVDLGDESSVHNETPVQKRAGGGKRDVRRIVLEPDAPREICVHVFRDRGWRIAAEAAPGVTEERVVLLTTLAALPSSTASKPKPEFLGTFRHPTDEDLQERKTQLSVLDEDGLVGLWEWCRAAQVHEGISPDMWSVYSPEHNDKVETAFRAGETKVLIEVGIRKYEVMFEGSSFGGRQVDTQHKKRRYVRRRAMTSSQREAVLQSAELALSNAVAEDPSLADAECVICADSFADTPALPVVQLPCGHRFHGACVQGLADKRKTCPCCRAEVNWRAVRSGYAPTSSTEVMASLPQACSRVESL